MSSSAARACSLLPLAALVSCGAGAADKSLKVLFADVSAPPTVTSARVSMGRPVPTPTADLHAIWGADANHMFAVGDRGTVMHGDGDRWRAFEIASSDTLHSVHGTDEADVWAVGGRTIAHFDGKGWSVTKLDIDEDLHAVWAADRECVFVAGSAGTIWKGRAGAWEITRTPAGKKPGIHGLWGLERTRVWAVGDEATLWQYDGNAWSKAPGPPSMFWSYAGDGAFGPTEGSSPFLRIWGAPSGHMFVANTESFVYEGGPEGWIQAHSGNPTDTRAVIGMWGTSSEEVILIEAGVSSYVYARRGVRETSCAVQNQVLTGVWGSDMANVWAVGHRGFVGKFDQKSLEADMNECLLTAPTR